MQLLVYRLYFKMGKMSEHLTDLYLTFEKLSPLYLQYFLSVHMHCQAWCDYTVGEQAQT